MTIGYSGLKNELNTDPLGLGYSGNVATGNDQGNANLLNALGSGSNFTIFRNDIAPGEVVGALGTTDFMGITSLGFQRIGLLFTGGVIDATSSGVRSNFAATFSGFTSGTFAALSALSSRQGSRAEVLFGNGTVVQASDVAVALRHT